MNQPYLCYALQDGYIHNWLVAGPWGLPEDESSSTGRGRSLLENGSGAGGPSIADLPQEGQALHVPGAVEPTQGIIWRAVRCEDDHLLDLTTPSPRQLHLGAWAYTRLEAQAPRGARLVVHAFGPAEARLNGRPVLRHEGSGPTSLPNGTAADVVLAEGANDLLIWFERRSGASPHALAVQISGADAVTAAVPSCTPHTDWRTRLEHLIGEAFVERALCAGGEAVTVRWPAGLRGMERVTIRVQTPEGQIVAEKDDFLVKASAAQPMVTGQEVIAGPYSVRLMPSLEQYYEQGVRVQRDIPVRLLHGRHSESPQGQGTLQDRAAESLEHAARWTRGIFGEIAKMALQWWSWVEPKAILTAIDDVSARHCDYYRTLIGLIHVACRYAGSPSFPPGLISPLEQCLLALDDEDEQSAAPCARGRAEDLSILRHAASILAGQRYPDRTFARSGQSGDWHRLRGEERAMAWLSRRAYGGFAAWDSNDVFESCLIALVHLIDFAQSDALRELATVVMDKLLFTLAANSFKGVFGSTHGATGTAAITDGRGEPTSGVGRLLWGTGSHNQHVGAVVSLVSSDQYELPSLFQAIATDLPEELWSRERHIVAWESQGEGTPTRAEEVNKVTFKTPDYMLSSAQDYRPGEPGCEEHIWQATLGPDAVVFVNHPANMSERDAYRPNFWRGNRILPRVAQWRDVLIALHRLPEDDWMGYTHAHVPLAAFDQFTLRGGWAFARKGDAYLALKASQEMVLTKAGTGGRRELRAHGRECVWLCQMGRKALDGSFAQFRRNVLALPVSLAGLRADVRALRGDQIGYGWTDPLIVNGEAQPLAGFPHYESVYCTTPLGAPTMEIQHGEWMLRLNLSMD